MERDLTSAKDSLSSSVLLLNLELYFINNFLSPISLHYLFFLSFFAIFVLSALLRGHFSLSFSSTTLCFFFLFALFIFTLCQVPRELHGRRQGWLHERKSSQWHAHHHPTQEVHGAHQDHLSTGEEAQTSVSSSDGGRRRPG